MNHAIDSLPVLVFYPHKRCNCRCLMCDIWKNTSEEEISFQNLERLREDLQRLRVQWIVFSGGEPLMHSDLFRLSSFIRSCGIRLTVLTTGLLLERKAQAIVESVDDVIVSLDGPELVHDQIRQVRGAFRRIASGIQALHQLDPNFRVAARSTIQRLNHGILAQTARAAHEIGCRSISFLAVDLMPNAFNRSDTWNDSGPQPLALSQSQIPDLEAAIDELLAAWSGSEFLTEDAAKFGRIVLHFRAHLGLSEPTSPTCNAPWTSAVIESNGTVRPCFFHKPIGTLGSGSLLQVLNGFEALSFRSSLDIGTSPICKRCVCSLNWKEPV